MKKILFILLILSFTLSKAQKTNIEIEFEGINDTIALLGYYYGNDKYILDTTKIKKNKAFFKNNKKYSAGMYFIALPQSQNIFFGFVLDNNQNFKIRSKFDNNKFTDIQFVNSEINNKFNEFNKRIENFNKQYLKLKNKYKTEENKNKDKIKDSLKILNIERKEYILNFYKNAKNKTLKNIIGLIIEPEEKIKNNDNKDSLSALNKYYYYKNHYWDFVDFQDSSIIRTPFFIPKFERYISKITIQNPDTIVAEGIKLIEKAKGNIPVFAYMVNYMLVYNEKSKLMGMDKAFVEIGKKYYLSGKAIWADSAYTAKIIDKIFRTEPNLIGEKAPAINNVVTIDGKLINLYDIDNDYIIIVFWEPSCGHCKTELPKLYNVYQDLAKQGIDIEVFAMLGDNDTIKWKNFIKDKNLTEWVNVWDKEWITNFKVFYDIYSTPTIYVLDKNKKIIAKRITADQVKEFVENREK